MYTRFPRWAICATRNQTGLVQLSDHVPWAPAHRWQPSLPATDAAAPLDGTGFCPMGATEPQQLTQLGPRPLLAADSNAS